MSFTCILAVHRFVFEGLCTALTKLMHESSAAPASISVPTPSFLCLPPPSSLPRFLSLSLSLSFLAFPSDIFALASLRVLPGCRLPSSVSPASLRPVMSCLPPLASSSTPRHNLPQTLKRSGCFARKSHSGNGIYAAIAELHCRNYSPIV